MQVVSVSQLQVGSLRWQPSEGRFALTVVAKATFNLKPGKASLAEVQDVPNDDDNHWNDDPDCSLYSASDLVPFKRRADVVLVGEAFAPGGEPARTLVARLCVGTVDKAIEVHCDRHFGPASELIEGQRYTRMPLRYERAAGGPHTTNPVGIDPEGERDLYGRVAVPNLTVPGATVSGPNETMETIGFGPIAPGWPTRRVLLGRHATNWSDRRWSAAPLPADFDGSFFNAAPIDQRLEELRDDERIVLENLHPTEPRLVCHLPGMKPRCFVERSGAVREIALRPDTMWIDTSRSICTVTWRGRIDLEHAKEKGRVVIALEKQGEHLTWGAVRKRAREVVHEESTQDAPAPLEEHTAVGIPAPGHPLPFVGAQRAQRTTGFPTGVTPVQRPVFQRSVEQARSGATGAIAVVQHPGDRSPAWLARDGSSFGEAVPQPRARSSHPPTPSAPPPPVAPVAQVPQTPIPPPPQDLSASISPWARKSLDDSMAPDLPTIAAPSVAVAQPAPMPVRPPNPVEALRDAPATPLPPPPSEPFDRAQGLAARPRQAHEVVELLWYDPEALPKIRAQRRWADLIDELTRKPDAEPLDFDEEPPPEEPQEVRDRRTVVAIMTRASVTSGFDLPQTMVDSVDASGTFEPPLVVMSGRLHLPFDQLETLKATLAAVTPLVAGNKDLQDTVDAVNELLKTPWLQEGSGDVAEGLTDKVRNAFKRGDRIVDPGYLDDHTDRILLERRCYQKRKLFGDEWIRGLLSPAATRARIPTYIPVKLHKELPMFKSFAARLIAEAHTQQDQYETHDCALKVVAFGRVVTFNRSQQLY